MKHESIYVNPACKQSCARYWFCSLPSLLINTDFRPPGHLLGVLWLSSSIGISAAHTVCKHRVCRVWGWFYRSFPAALLLCWVWRARTAWPCFPVLTMMSVFPADQPLSRTWSVATQMAWETAKVSRPFFALICPPLLCPLLLHLSSPSTWSPSFLERPFPSSLLSPFCAPSVPPSQSTLSGSFIHLSLSALILHCPFPRCFSGPLVNRPLCPVGQRLGLFSQTASRTRHKQPAAHREGVWLVSRLRAHLETQNNLSSQATSEVLKALFFTHQSEERHIKHVIISCSDGSDKLIWCSDLSIVAHCYWDAWIALAALALYCLS